jgi:DNA-directed RNA polymerase specialized sigma24 family protein
MTPADFTAVYTAHRARILAYCARRVGDAAAEDVAQQVWETIRESGRI